ncbi:MAG: DUF805 domain-containing protein [Hyphomonas sp.]|uniref:DUF805 domain-containing protein n=1 Tax=Hyphomonas sp. TaxID=87 RepID=UPI003528FA7F
MKGIVVRAVLAGDAGEIRGTDGKIYLFGLNQVRHGAVPVVGQQVDFIGLGDEARDIHVDAVPPEAPPMPAPAGIPVRPVSPQTIRPPLQPSAAYGAASAVEVPAGSLWTYFLEGLTTKYVRFTGRARRAEYWGYTMFWWIGTVLAAVLDVIILGITTPSGGEPFWLFFLSVLWHLGTVLPNIAIVVRRLHDLNMSGWVYLAKLGDFFIPFLGTGIIFIFTLMDSKPEANEHGPSPKYDQPEDSAAVFS